MWFELGHRIVWYTRGD